MRLKHLKLAGFKSFVDPTKIEFTQALSGVVGPNGCGKSNIIDAVRWVLGESSAKNLRGDGMSDVIFNGSSARKPVSVASVELLFDNSEGKAGGAWSRFSEIAIKRQVSREGQSDYFVNGEKCRRRDISDLLSGTGLGPRSYAIIEQGTVSRLVESKPNELRVFIEEAAGITKYKERKRDTETRIKQSRDNLSRLKDIRHELEAQIASLESQATLAQDYKSLKAQERELNQNIIVKRWKTFFSELAAVEQQLSIGEYQSGQLTDGIADIENNFTQSNQQQQQTQQALQVIEQDIFRLEKAVNKWQLSITHLTDSIEQIENKNTKSQLKLDALNVQSQDMQLALQQSTSQAEQAQQQLAGFEEAVAQSSLSLDQIQVEHENKESQASEINLQKQQYSQQLLLAQQAKDRVSHDKIKLASQVELLSEKRHSLEASLNAISPNALQSDVEQLQQQVQAFKTQLDSVDSLQSEHQQLSMSVESDLEQSRVLVAELSAKEQMTRLLIDKHSGDAETPQRLMQAQQLWRRIEVAPPWQLAVQTVLERHLSSYVTQALVIDDSMPAHSQLFHGLTTPLPLNAANGLVRLSDHVVCDDDVRGIVDHLCHNIFCVADIEQASQTLSTLQSDSSLVTAQGDWLGQYFAFIKGDKAEAELGILSLESQHKQQSAALNDAQQQLNNMLLKLENNRLAQQQLTEKNTRLNEQLSSSNQKLSDHKQQWLLAQQQWQQSHSQLEDINAQLEQTNKLAAIEMQQLSAYTQQIKQLSEQLKETDAQLKRVKQAIHSSHSNMKQEQKSAALAQQSLHQQQMLIQKHQLKQQSCQIQYQSVTEQCAELQQQITENQQQQQESSVPLVKNKQQLAIDQKELIAKQLQCDNLKQQTRTLLATHQTQQQMLAEHTHNQQTLAAQLEKWRVKKETLKVKLTAQEQALSLGSRDLMELANGLTEENQSKYWQQALQEIQDKLGLMGAINLTAIEQYNEQKQRLDYLEQQNFDLESGLKTLESAIEKIDRQSRDKFKITFDNVNKDFRKLFPKVFGGGSAQLTLTDSDLLISGVSIMAQPPGKKNSTIHLLSGGEKALTALSLVFAIFKQNPAPFCLLDEVDAPLDDANVDRYCNLVKEMSEKVQFIYITHNKVSMEMASQLTGITMQEAGVSRVVCVDVDAAVSLAHNNEFGLS